MEVNAEIESWKMKCKTL
jgi:hypothetical protein